MPGDCGAITCEIHLVENKRGTKVEMVKLLLSEWLSSMAAVSTKVPPRSNVDGQGVKIRGCNVDGVERAMDLSHGCSMQAMGCSNGIALD